MTPVFKYPEILTEQIDGKRFYRVDPDRAYPSITTVLGNTMSAEKSDTLRRWRERVGNEEADRRTKNAQDRGTVLHSMIEHYVQTKQIITDGISPEHLKLFYSIRTELHKIGQVFGQEMVLYSDLMQVAGRCDLAAIYSGEAAIIDAKSSYWSKNYKDVDDYFLQTCFYALAHNEQHGTNIDKLVLIMAVENDLPHVFKRSVTEEMVEKLLTRIEQFYMQ